jgi:CheY-like chemotaxis protein
VKVLLVTAQPRVALSVGTALLGEPDVEITEVASPQRAVALLDEGHDADVVVADADTAPTGGFALSREIKAREQMGRDMPPVVLLIARPQDDFLSDWSQADAHVLKPADPFDLAQVVRAVTYGEPLPELPGVGGAPTEKLGKMPGPAYETEAVESGQGPEDARA